jgi:hypothetical protein
MQTKTSLLLLRESCPRFLISSAFKEGNLIIWVDTYGNPTYDHPFAMQRLWFRFGPISHARQHFWVLLLNTDYVATGRPLCRRQAPGGGGPNLSLFATQARPYPKCLSIPESLIRYRAGPCISHSSLDLGNGSLPWAWAHSAGPKIFIKLTYSI